MSMAYEVWDIIKVPHLWKPYPQALIYFLFLFVDLGKILRPSLCHTGYLVLEKFQSNMLPRRIICTLVLLQYGVSHVGLFIFLSSSRISHGNI